jgi:hypothetical protein
MVMRFETDFNIGNLPATTTAGAMLFSPGAISSSSDAGAPGFGVLSLVANDDVTATGWSAGGPGNYLPGYTYLRDVASSYRCLGFCVQIYWPGTELNRQGLVSVAQSTYGFGKGVPGNYTVAQLRAMSPIVERMPNEYLEAKWAPNFSDGLFRDPTSTGRPEDGHASILITWAGVQAGAPIRVRAVGVYEWLPRTTGITLNSNTSTAPDGNIQTVRRELDRTNANWWVGMGHAAYNFASGVTVAYMNSKGVNFGRPAPPLLRWHDDL